MDVIEGSPPQKISLEQKLKNASLIKEDFKPFIGPSQYRERTLGGIQLGRINKEQADRNEGLLHLYNAAIYSGIILVGAYYTLM